MNTFQDTVTLKNGATISEIGFIKNQEAGTKADKASTTMTFDEVITELENKCTTPADCKWDDDIGQQSQAQLYVLDNKGAYHYTKFEYIQPSESNVTGKCMQFDFEVSYQKDDELTKSKKKFVEDKKVKPGMNKSDPNAKKAVSLTNLSEKQTLKLKTVSNNQDCPGQDGLTVEKIVINPEPLKSLEAIFNKKSKRPATECVKDTLSCTNNNPAQGCGAQNQCENIKDDEEVDRIVCHQSEGKGQAKIYTGCKVNQKGDSSKPSFENKTQNPRFTKMGKDMAASNVPAGGNKSEDVEIKTEDFNFNYFDKDGCIKLEASIWLSNSKYAKTEIEQCVDPCKLAKKIFDELPPDTKPFKQQGEGLSGDKKVDTKSQKKDAKLNMQSSAKFPQFVQKSVFMEVEQEDNELLEKSYYIDSKGKDSDQKGGKERKGNQLGLAGGKTEQDIDYFVENFGFDGEGKNSVSLKCENEDGSQEMIGPKQKLPQFEVPDAHSCMKIKLPKFKTQNGSKLDEYTPQNAKQNDPKAFKIPKQPLDIELQLDDSQCKNGEKAAQYKILDIEIRTYDDLSKDKQFFSEVKQARMGCDNAKCQVLDEGEYEFLEIPIANCKDNDSKFPGKKVCSYEDPETFETKTFVRSVGDDKSPIDYSAFDTCQAGSGGDCQKEAECKKGTKGTVNFDTDCSAYKTAIQKIRGSAEEDMSSFERAPDVDYKDKFFKVKKVQRKSEKKLAEITEQDLDVGKIAPPTKNKDGSVSIPEGGFKKQIPKSESGEKAPTKPQKAGQIPNVDDVYNTVWRINPFELKDGTVDKSKEVAPKEGRSIYIFAIIKKKDEASPDKTIINTVKREIKVFEKEIKVSEKPEIKFLSTNEIEIGQKMKFKAQILGGLDSEAYTLKFQRINKETNEKEGEVFEVGTGKKVDVDISAGQVSKMFGYRRQNIELSFEVYDQKGVLVNDERVQIKTKLPEKPSQELECIELSKLACFKGTDITEEADLDLQQVPIVHEGISVSCTPVISTQNCQQGKFQNLQVTQVIARTTPNIKEEYWKKGLDEAPDKECKERPIICSSEIEFIKGSEVTQEIKQVKCKDIYNSKELPSAASRKDSKGKSYIRAQAHSEEEKDEEKYSSTERKEKPVDKQMSDKRPACYVYNPEQKGIYGPDSPCANLKDQSKGDGDKVDNCPLSKKCYDLLESEDKDIRENAECRKALEDWADSFPKTLSFEEEYESENELNDKFEEAFEEQLPYFVTIQGNWFKEKNQYFDFFMKVVLNDGDKVFTLDSSARIYVANRAPPSEDEWVDLKVKPAPTVVDWNTPFTFTPNKLMNLKTGTNLKQNQGYRVILQAPNPSGDGFVDLSATNIGEQISIDFRILFEVYKMSREENDFGEKKLIDYDQNSESEQSNENKNIPSDLSDYKKKLYEQKLLEESFDPESKYGEQKRPTRFCRLLLEYPTGFTIPTPLQITIKPPQAPSVKPAQCAVATTIGLKYDNTDNQKKNDNSKPIISAQRSTAFEVNVDLSGCSAWAGYKVDSVEVRDYNDLNLEAGFRGAENKGVSYCKKAMIGCGDVRGNGVECFDSESNLLTERKEGEVTVYDNEFKECFTKDSNIKHPIELKRFQNCFLSDVCSFDKACFYEVMQFRSPKCFGYKKVLNELFANADTNQSQSNENQNQQKTPDQLKVESKINEKLGKAKFEQIGGKPMVFIERLGDSVSQSGVKELTFHIVLTKPQTAEVFYLKETVEFDFWKPKSVPEIKMKESKEDKTGKIFRDWGSPCSFQVEAKNQDPTLQLNMKPSIEKNKESEDKFDDGESNLNDLEGGSTLNPKQCFETFGVAAKKSGAKMKVDVFNGIDKVGEKQFDVVLKAPGKSDIKPDCVSNKPTISISEKNVENDTETPLTKNANKYDITLSKEKDLIIKVNKDNSCSTKPDFKIMLSYAEDLSKEQCLYSDPKCKDLGDCEKVSSIPCDQTGCTIEGEDTKLQSVQQPDKDSNQIKRLNGKYDCYVQVNEGVTAFNGRKALPESKPKFQIPIEQVNDLGEIKIPAEASEFLKKVLTGEAKLFVHVFQYDKTNDSDNAIDYYQTDPIHFNFAKAGLEIKDVEGSNQEDFHPSDKDIFIRPNCQNPGAKIDGVSTQITTKYKCPDGIDQKLCDQSAGKALEIPKSALKNLSGDKVFEVICEQTDQNGAKKQVKKNATVKIQSVPDCPKLKILPESIEYNENKKGDTKLKIKISTKGCPNGFTLDSLAFTNSNAKDVNFDVSLKPADKDGGELTALLNNDEVEITKLFTKEQLSVIKHKNTHVIDVVLTANTGSSITVKGRFKLFRKIAQLKGKAKGGNRIYYKGDKIALDLQITDAQLQGGAKQDYESEAKCPKWIQQEDCDELPGKNFEIEKFLTDKIPQEEIGKPQKFEFNFYAQDGRELYIPATLTILDQNLKSQNIPQVILHRENDDKAYAKYGEVFIYAKALNSETGLEEDIDLDSWDISWNFFDSATGEEVKDIPKFEFGDFLTVDLESVRKAGEKQYKAELTLTRKSDQFSFKTSQEMKTAPALKKGKVQLEEKEQDGKAKRFSFNFENYEGIEQFEIRCVKKGKDIEDKTALARNFASQSASFQDISLPNSEDNDCYEIAKDENGQIVTQKLEYSKPKKTFSDRNEAITFAEPDSFDDIFENDIFNQADDDGKEEFFKDFSSKLETDLISKRDVNGYIPSTDLGNSLNNLKSFMKNLDLKAGSANLSDIESKTTASMELALDSVIQNFSSLSDSDIVNAFECIVEMEEQLSLSEKSRSSSKSRKHQIISQSLSTAREGQVKKYETSSGKVMYSQFSPSTLKSTVEFQATSTDPKVKVQADTLQQIGNNASLTKVNIVATSSDKIPTGVQNGTTEFPMQKTQSIEVTSTDGKAVNVSGLSEGKEVKIDFPTFNLASGKACKGNYIDEAKSSLDQTDVECTFDSATNVPTVKTKHLTTFIVTVEDNGTVVTPTESSDSDDDGLSGGAIAGIVIGSLVFVAGVVLLTIFLVKKAKKKRMQKSNQGRMSVLQEDSKKNQVSPQNIDSSNHHIPTEQRFDMSSGNSEQVSNFE